MTDKTKDDSELQKNSQPADETTSTDAERTEEEQTDDVQNGDEADDSQTQAHADYTPQQTKDREETCSSPACIRIGFLTMPRM